MAYELLREAAHNYTEHLVVEAGVDTESVVKSLLPWELVSLLQQSLEIVDIEEDPSSVRLGSCCWSTSINLAAENVRVLARLDDGLGSVYKCCEYPPLLPFLRQPSEPSSQSMKVKSGYSEHLQELGLVTTHLIPLVLNLLQLYGGVVKGVKLDVWSVDQFYVERKMSSVNLAEPNLIFPSVYDPDNSLSARLLVAHVYYRALLTIPSLVREWLADCKDKNLFTSVTNYTATHFSPVIINTELTSIKSPEGLEELNAENLTVKVASAVNEVTAAYNVDEHQLELTLKIPSDWPLQRVTVKDSKRIGVPENRWRGWLLGVQQIVWSQVCVFCQPCLSSIPPPPHHPLNKNWPHLSIISERTHRRRDQPFQEERYLAL